MLAINLGGAEYTATDGTEYSADVGNFGGQIRSMTAVKGTQDAPLYSRFRQGDLQFEQSIPNGRYDVTLMFAEPDPVEVGERLFDTFLEGSLVVRGLDIRASRDGKTESALTVTVPDVSILDGALSLRLEASVGEPVLSALVVRAKHEPEDAWRLVWRDEFEGSALDTSKWSADVWPARKVNGEDQAYTQRTKNLRVADGMLVIEAHLEDYDGARYTSSRVHSRGAGDFLYGRFEIRARLPAGEGTWPAVWMLPSDPFRYATQCGEGTDWQGNPDCDAWPNSGEIDIMEHVGHELGHVHGTVHNRAYYWKTWDQRKGRILLPNVDNEFHVYALEWSADRIDVFVDDTLYFTYMKESDDWQTWPYDHPFHLILNLAVGGMWGRAGGNIDDSAFPQSMLVDYVRVYSTND